MKYKPNTNYCFECEIIGNGMHGKNIEDQFKELLKKIIKDCEPNMVIFSSESLDRNERTTKMFNILEELQCVKNGTIIYLGRIPDSWKEQLKNEMEEKKELNKKRIEHLNDCLMMIIRKEKKDFAIILNRKGIYSISNSPPR